MWTKNLQHKKDYTQQDYSFNGVNIHAAPGIHELAYELFVSLDLKKDIKICILGAGAGAFDERLYSDGFKNIIAIEFNPQIYTSKGKVLSIDLNGYFSNVGKFDVIVALELIEHLENHFDFIRQVKSLLEDSGNFIMSTPNPKNSFSRFKFFLLGNISYFNFKDILTSGHINPVWDHIFKYYLKELNMNIVSEKKINVWSLLRINKNFPKKIIIFLSFLITRFIKNKDDRAMLIYLISK